MGGRAGSSEEVDDDAHPALSATKNRRASSTAYRDFGKGNLRSRNATARDAAVDPRCARASSDWLAGDRVRHSRRALASVARDWSRLQSSPRQSAPSTSPSPRLVSGDSRPNRLCEHTPTRLAGSRVLRRSERWHGSMWPPTSRRSYARTPDRHVSPMRIDEVWSLLANGSTRHSVSHDRQRPGRSFDCGPAAAHRPGLSSTADEMFGDLASFGLTERSVAATQRSWTSPTVDRACSSSSDASEVTRRDRRPVGLMTRMTIWM